MQDDESKKTNTTDSLLSNVQAYNHTIELDDSRIPTTTENDISVSTITLPTLFHTSQHEQNVYRLNDGVVVSKEDDDDSITTFVDFYNLILKHRNDDDPFIGSSLLKTTKHMTHLLRQSIAHIQSLPQKSLFLVNLEGYHPYLHIIMYLASYFGQHIHMNTPVDDTSTITCCFTDSAMTETVDYPVISLAQSSHFTIQQLVEGTTQVDMTQQEDNQTHCALVFDNASDHLLERTMLTQMHDSLFDVIDDNDCCYNTLCAKESSTNEILRCYAIEAMTLVKQGSIVYECQEGITTLLADPDFLNTSIVPTLQKKATEGGFLSKYIYKRAFNEKKVAQAKGIAVPFWNFLLIDKMKASLSLASLRTILTSIQSPHQAFAHQEFIQVLCDAQMICLTGSSSTMGIGFRTVKNDWRILPLFPFVSTSGSFELCDRPEQFITVADHHLGECKWIQSGESTHYVVAIEKEHQALYFIEPTMTPTTPQEKAKAQLLSTFRALDQDHSGSLEENEIRHLLLTFLGEDYPDLDGAVAQVFESCDSDDNHVISFDEFSQVASLLITLKLNF